MKFSKLAAIIGFHRRDLERLQHDALDKFKGGLFASDFVRLCSACFRRLSGFGDRIAYRILVPELAKDFTVDTDLFGELLVVDLVRAKMALSNTDLSILVRLDMSEICWDRRPGEVGIAIFLEFMYSISSAVNMGIFLFFIDVIIA